MRICNKAVCRAPGDQRRFSGELGAKSSTAFALYLCGNLLVSFGGDDWKATQVQAERGGEGKG